MPTELDRPTPKHGVPSHSLQALARRHLWLHYTRMGGYGAGRTRSRSSCAARAATSTTSTARATSTRCRRCSASTPATAGPSWRRPPRPRSASWTSSRTGATPIRGRSSWPNGSPAWRRRGLNASSSRAAARRPSSRPGSSPVPTTACAASRPRTKIVARELAYHGSSLGALAATGLPELKDAFEPVTPGACHVAEHLRLPLAGRPRPAVGGRRDRGSGSSRRDPRPSPR